MTGIDPADAESFRAALAAMKPVECVRCGAVGEVPTARVELMIHAHRHLTPVQLRTIAIRDALVACADCATPDELVNAENEIRTAEVMWEHGGPAAAN